MSDEKPPMPPGLPAMPPMPPAPPGMEAPGAPPAPPGMPPMPPMPSMDAPPAPPSMPPMPPMPEMDAPPAPPGMPAMPPMPEMDAPPAPPGMPAMPPMPEMDAPPAPPMPEMDAPPAPPMPEMDAPPAPPMPEMDAPPAPPMPEMDAPPAPPMPEMDAPPAPPMPEMDAPPAPPMPEMDAPPAPPGMPPMPPMPEMDAPPAPPGMPPMPPMPEMEAEAPDASALMSDSAALLGAPAPPAMEEEAPAEDTSVLDTAALLGSPAPPAPPEEVAEIPALPESLTPDPVLGSPDNLMGEQAGAVIRSSAEVDEVVGDKLEGTLHEVEKATLSADGEVIKQTVKGTLKVNNPSAEDRIYDIDVMLDHADATDIGGDNVSVDELEAGANYSMKYKVSGKRMLVLRERLDTNPARSQEHSLSVASSEEGGPIALEIEVENTASVAINDVLVSRPLPDEFSFDNTGAASLEDNTLSWDVGTLAAGEKQVLSIEGTIVVSGTKSINAGVASATYTSNSTLSNLNFRELDAFCRGFSYMRVREDERPDNWICRTTFENRSSFAVDLVKLQVRMKGSDDLLFDISDVRQDVKPHGKWESEERTVMAQSKPDFATELAYTILPRASRSTEGSISLEAKTLQVVEANLEKVYSTTGLRSYRSQKVTATLTLTNNGSADINLMRITDDIPGLFDAPDVSAMTIKVNGKEIDAEQIKSEINSGITLEKTNRSPDGDGHTLTVTVGARGPVGLKPGKSMTIEYDLVAPDPSPDNSNITAPARTEFSAERYGPVCTVDTTEAPAISVIHNRRDFSFGKTTQKIGGKGRHEVLILFSNDGDTALKDVILTDIIPEKFEIKDWLIRGNSDKRDDCEMNTEAGEDGTHITWTIPIVEKGERLEVSFEIHGPGVIDGEAGNRFHGVHFGDEVESEDIASPVEEAIEEEAAEEVVEEAAEEEVEINVSWREDVLLRVMAAADIDVALRDDFVAHAVNFDSDNNGYLKKAELQAAADAWNAESEEVVAEEKVEEAAEEEATEEAAEEEATEEAPSEEAAEEKACPTCDAMCAADATSCQVCFYTF